MNDLALHEIAAGVFHEGEFAPFLPGPGEAKRVPSLGQPPTGRDDRRTLPPFAHGVDLRSAIAGQRTTRALELTRDGGSVPLVAW